MAEPGSASWLDQALNAGSTEVVPLVVLVDESPFAESVADNLLSWIPEANRSACCLGPLGDWRTTWERVIDASFRTRIHPQRLWEGQAPWLVVVADLGSNVSKPDVVSALRAITEVGAPGAFVIPVFKGDLDLTDWAGVRSALSFLSTPCVFLSDRAAVRRSADLLARGTAGFVLAGWERYLRDRTGNWRAALGYVGEEKVYSLGMAVDEPDWRFHGHGWIDATLQEMARDWTTAGSSPERPSFPRAVDIAEAHAPSRNYRVERDHEKEGPALVLGQVDVRYGFVSPPTVPEFRSHRDRTSLSERLRGLRAFRYGLQISERAAAERLLGQRARDWSWHIRATMTASFEPPERPLGLFRWMRGGMDLWTSYLGELSSTSVRPAGNVRSAEANLKRVVKREGRVPSLSGVALRMGLLVVGSFWTVWGTFFWANQRHPWNDPGMHRMLWLSLGGIAALTVAVVLHYGWTHLSSLRAEAVARRDLMTAYMGDLVALIRSRIVASSDALRAEVEHWSSCLDDLQRWAGDVSSGRERTEHARPANRNPRFPPEALKEVCSRRLPDLAVDAHRQVCGELLADKRWPLFEVSVWRELVRKAVEERVTDQLRQITYDEAVASADWTDSARGHLVADLVKDARKPAFEADVALHAPVTLFGGSAWQAQVEQQQGVKRSNHSFPFLVAVAILPLRHPELDGGRQG